MKTGKLFVFSAPSGSGKTTIVRNVLKENPDFVFSISATTRKCRKMETHRKDYFFITEEEFKRNIAENKFVEWEQFYGYYYGTLKSFIDSNIHEGRSVVFEVDVKGAIQIKNHYPEAVLIFVKPPSLEILKQRLIERKTECEEDLKKRFERMEMELSYESHFDHVVINESLQNAIEEVKKIIELNKMGEEK
ncbi:MAG: guanylate kinase [Bacteroidetes bacterium]|nr:guanylate kinase [Bacteroidota bacterium]MBU1678604.1 guanylate kinase [Bacteroidota bacterium]MBU2506824.1 guanylate kinase [Bacteroidota bacterium]